MARAPRLALALLDRFAPGNEPLAGDLLEEYERGRSSLWLWRQVLAAIIISAFRAPREVSVLKLADSSSAVPPPRVSRSDPLPRSVNLSASPVSGIGGLGILAIALLISLVAPQIWWVLLIAVAGGALLGAAWILLRKREHRGSGGEAREGPETRI
jgi:hypothetical protein